MTHRNKKGESGGAGADIGRRAALTRLGLGVSVAYAAPILLTLSSAEAGVVVGDGDLNNNGGADGGAGSSGSSGLSGASGASGSGKRKKKKKGKKEKKRKKKQKTGKKKGRMTLQQLFNYLGNIGKRKK